MTNALSSKAASASSRAMRSCRERGRAKSNERSAVPKRFMAEQMVTGSAQARVLDSVGQLDSGRRRNFPVCPAHQGKWNPVLVLRLWVQAHPTEKRHEDSSDFRRRDRGRD